MKTDNKHEHTKRYLVMHFSFLLYSIIQVMTKLTSSIKMLSLGFFASYTLILMGYAVYAFFWQQTLKKFSLITAFSNRGSTVLWAMLWSSLVFNETVSWKNILGFLIVLSGIILVNRDV